jgi:hypothetical protein
MKIMQKEKINQKERDKYEGLDGVLYPTPGINAVLQQQDRLPRASGPLGSQCGEFFRQ